MRVHHVLEPPRRKYRFGTSFRSNFRPTASVATTTKKDQYPQMWTRYWRRCVLGVGWLSVLMALARAQQPFNREVEKRILERLEFYLRDPVTTSQMIFNFRENGVFPNRLQAEDRDLYLGVAYGVQQPLVYYAREDGSISG